MVLETKTNTIGSQYPFIFRNGNVDYKEFPVSGLISCQSDEENLFFKTKDFDGTIDLINTNIYEEREFKLEVLDWLNDGKPKLFKSPVEGNYLVRLLNISLTPIDTVGRMLHSFTATASQIAEQTHEALIEQNIISLELIKVKDLKWMSVELNKASSQNLLEYAPAVSLTFEGMIPGDKVYIDEKYRDRIESEYLKELKETLGEFECEQSGITMTKVMEQDKRSYTVLIHNQKINRMDFSEKKELSDALEKVAFIDPNSNFKIEFYAE